MPHPARQGEHERLGAAPGGGGVQSRGRRAAVGDEPLDAPVRRECCSCCARRRLCRTVSVPRATVARSGSIPLPAQLGLHAHHTCCGWPPPGSDQATNERSEGQNLSLLHGSRRSIASASANSASPPAQRSAACLPAPRASMPQLSLLLLPLTSTHNPNECAWCRLD